MVTVDIQLTSNGMADALGRVRCVQIRIKHAVIYEPPLQRRILGFRTVGLWLCLHVKIGLR